MLLENIKINLFKELKIKLMLYFKNIEKVSLNLELLKLLSIMVCKKYQVHLFGDNKLIIILKKMLMILN